VNELEASIYSASAGARGKNFQIWFTVRGSSIDRKEIDGSIAKWSRLTPKNLLEVVNNQHDFVDRMPWQYSSWWYLMSAVNASGSGSELGLQAIALLCVWLRPTLHRILLILGNEKRGLQAVAQQLKKVPRLGDKALQQAAWGFTKLAMPTITRSVCSPSLSAMMLVQLKWPKDGQCNRGGTWWVRMNAGIEINLEENTFRTL